MTGTPSTAILGYGTKIAVETAAGSGTYTELGEVTNVTPPNASIDQVEVTHMQSPDRTKEFIAGLADLGDAKFSINWIPSNATDSFILAWRASGEKRGTRITYPNAAKDDFLSFPTGYSPTASTADKMSADVTLKVAGAVVRS